MTVHHQKHNHVWKEYSPGDFHCTQYIYYFVNGKKTTENKWPCPSIKENGYGPYCGEPYKCCKAQGYCHRVPFHRGQHTQEYWGEIVRW